MKHETDSFDAYLQTRAGIIHGGRITETQIYRAYVQYCEKKGFSAKSHEELQTRIHNEIWAITLWWGAIVPHLTDTMILGEIDDSL